MDKNIKENKITTYTGEKTRIQLLRITTQKKDSRSTQTIKYQIRMNRKRVYTTGIEYDARKCFATLVQNNILQLKIY